MKRQYHLFNIAGIALMFLSFALMNRVWWWWAVMAMACASFLIFIFLWMRSFLTRKDCSKCDKQ